MNKATSTQNAASCSGTALLSQVSPALSKADFTFSDFLPVYINYLEGKVRPITIDVRKRLLVNHFIPYLQNKPILLHTPQSFETALRAAVEHVRFAALYPVISHFLSAAVILGYLPQDKELRTILQSFVKKYGRRTERHVKEREMYCRQNILNRSAISSVSNPEVLCVSGRNGLCSVSFKGFYYDDLRDDVRSYVHRMINAGSTEASYQSFICQMRAYDRYLFKTNQPYDRNFPMIEDDYREYLSTLKASDGTFYSGHTIAGLLQKPMTLYYYLKDTDQVSEPDDYADIYLPDYFENHTYFA